MKGQSKPSGSQPVAVLEVTPRTAKLLLASSSPVQIQRVNASTLADQGSDTVAALRGLLEAQSPPLRHVTGLLFGREVFSLQTLELPSSDPKEIASMLELQLGKLTPYPRSDILFASTPVGSFRDGYTTVLLAITRKALIDEVLQFCKTKGLSPQWVGVSTEGLEAWWAATRPETGAASSASGLTVLIDVDYASTDCAILSAAGRLLFTHSIPIGAEQLNASEPAKLRWMGELIRLPRILSHEEVKGQIARGVITGATEGLHSAADQLVSQWGASVEVKDPLQGRSTETARARAQVTRVSYTALVGALLANRAPRIDLIPHEMRVSQALHTRSKHLTQFVVNLAIVLSLAVVLYIERTVILGSYLGQLRERLAPLEQTSRDILWRHETMRQIRGWLDPGRSALAVLQAVGAAADPAITVTQLTFKQGEPVRIRGTAGTSQAPYEFLDRLKKQKVLATGPSCFAEVKVSGTRGAEFEISCQLEGS